MSTSSRKPQLTLYCLAHAGGSAESTFAQWPSFLPREVEVVPLELPGHGRRLREPLLDSVESIVALLAAQVRERTGPFALFGHSLGAVVAFALARHLADRGRHAAALLVSGRNAPGEAPSHRLLHDRPDSEFLNALVEYGGLPQALLDEKELLDLYLPVLRNDIRIAETGTLPPDALNIPLMAFAGLHDRLTHVARVAAWESHTTAGFELCLIEGGHFYLTDQEFRCELARQLRRIAGDVSISVRSHRCAQKC
ncbi:thioesterase II family protein [Streptomyces purpurogeneiscleroticus]|uniref:thioesterase II family protein n=1 Tax=Streptomyces purpurogeneiscleroticus TaxID=68259 RepID=UPI001CC0879C|nr:alpha/beta fold hydrolase [Streptomyces purpurogeneiscleroticus]